MKMKISLNIFLILFLAFSSCKPKNQILGIQKDPSFIFLPCPKKPNCITSNKNEPNHYLEPIKILSKDSSVARVKLLKILKSMNMTILINKNNYIHGQFKSSFFKFIDDIEFYISSKKNLIHFRSASQIGHSDFSVNKKRIEKIRFKYYQNDY